MDKSTWMEDVQGGEAGQFGVWLCVEQITVLDGRKVRNLEH
jgi:hypothetical protein